VQSPLATGKWRPACRIRTDGLHADPSHWCPFFPYAAVSGFYVLGSIGDVSDLRRAAIRSQRLLLTHRVPARAPPALGAYAEARDGGTLLPRWQVMHRTKPLVMRRTRVDRAHSTPAVAVAKHRLDWLGRAGRWRMYQTVFYFTMRHDGVGGCKQARLTNTGARRGGAIAFEEATWS